MAFRLLDLPYPLDALAPILSKETLEFHYGKHHNTYVTNLNKLAEGTPFAGMSLDDVIMKAEGPIFNNAAQVWNHNFYWHCLQPKGKHDPRGKIGTEIKATWGTIETFKNKFEAAATGLFGSGWAWLVRNKDGSLAIEQTSNAGCPLTTGAKPLLTCDVWEHAYYIDYRNERPRYVLGFWELVNWDFVEQNATR